MTNVHDTQGLITNDPLVDEAEIIRNKDDFGSFTLEDEFCEFNLDDGDYKITVKKV